VLERLKMDRSWIENDVKPPLGTCLVNGLTLGTSRGRKRHCHVAVP
jgi:hypothetical protein